MQTVFGIQSYGFSDMKENSFMVVSGAEKQCGRLRGRRLYYFKNTF